MMWVTLGTVGELADVRPLCEVERLIPISQGKECKH